MHYRNGREANNGDLVVRINDSGVIEAVGVLQNAEPGNEYCNGEIKNLESGHESYACMCDCLHVEDLAELLVQAKLHKRPEGM